MKVYTATEEAYKKGYDKGREEGAKITAEIEHELSEQRNALAYENETLKAKLDFVNGDYNSLQSEFARLRAQMDIVYLIFGGK